MIDGARAEADQIPQVWISSDRSPVQFGMGRWHGIHASIEAVLEILDAQVRVRGGHALIRNAHRDSVPGGALRQHYLGTWRRFEHGRQRGGIHVAGMSV